MEGNTAHGSAQVTRTLKNGDSDAEAFDPVAAINRAYEHWQAVAHPVHGAPGEQVEALRIEFLKHVEHLWPRMVARHEAMWQMLARLASAEAAAWSMSINGAAGSDASARACLQLHRCGEHARALLQVAGVPVPPEPTRLSWQDAHRISDSMSAAGGLPFNGPLFVLAPEWPPEAVAAALERRGDYIGRGALHTDATTAERYRALANKLRDGLASPSVTAEVIEERD